MIADRASSLHILKCIDWTSSLREIALLTVTGSLVLMFDIFYGFTVLELQRYSQLELYHQLKVVLKVAWIQDQIRCCYFVADI